MAHYARKGTFDAKDVYVKLSRLIADWYKGGKLVGFGRVLEHHDNNVTEIDVLLLDLMDVRFNQEVSDRFQWPVGNIALELGLDRINVEALLGVHGLCLFKVLLVQRGLL